MELLDTISIQDSEITELHGLLKYAVNNLKTTLDHHVDLLKETQSSSVKKENINLEATLKKVCQSINSLITNSRTEVSSDFTAFNEVRFNLANLESIFLNFLSNFIKYSRPGIHSKIKFYTQLNGNKKQLYVEDNGLGFDSENLEDKIFGINEKLSENSESKGVGL